jgi:hypothetical protein
MDRHTTRESTDAPAARDEASASIQAQHALVIGIGEYGPGFRTLPNAPSDAQAVAVVLAREYGFTLIPAQATQAVFRSAVEESLKQADATTRWLFYFAGHGHVQDAQGYLLPSDAVKDKLDTYLPLRWLLDTCLASGCGEALIILDACYGGRALVRPDDLSDLIPASRADRVRQLITSGNPDQPVLDDGGSGHSVFTQSLLEALQGWAGIHDDDGAIRFTRLLDHLAFEIPARLRALGRSAAEQQPIGGNLIGHRTRRDFVLRPIVPRLSPETVQGARNDDPVRRRENLSRLASEAKAHPDARPLAVQLAAQHLQREPQAPFLVTATLRYEPVPQVRAEAAKTLGELGDLSAVEPLITALADAPDVCRAAAAALGGLGNVRAAVPLLERLRHADDTLFLDLVGATGALGEPAATLGALMESLRRSKLVPFLGPDFPPSLTGLPDRATVARELARREGLPSSDSLSATAAATMGPGGSRFTFTDFLRRQWDDPRARPGPIHLALAALKVPFWIDGAYDGMLARALNANAMVTGDDTQYWRPERPTVVRLVGDVSRPDSLLVIEPDYAQLRANEGDRRLLVSFLREELQGKVVLLLGYDPSQPDFALLVKHVLNEHLAGIDVRAFIVWPVPTVEYNWAGHVIQSLTYDWLEFVQQLGVG